MPLPYRTILRFPADTDLVGLAERQLQSWIESKKKVDRDKRGGFLSGAFFAPGVHDLGSGRTLRVAASDEEIGTTRRRLFRFTEPTKNGVWQVDLLALDASDGSAAADTLIVESRRVDAPDAEGQVDPPRVVRQLLEEIEVLDGRTPVTAQAQIVRESDVEVVFAAITDPARSVSVIVAAPSSREGLADFRKVVDLLTANLVGTASVFVLDYDATFALRTRLPDSHMVGIGRIRTFMPHVDLTSPADGRRHRILGPQTLNRVLPNSGRVPAFLQQAFVLQTRGVQLAAPLPRSLRRQWESLERAISALLREETIRTATEERLREDIEGVTLFAARESLAERLRRVISRFLGKDVPEPDLEHIDELESHWVRVEAAANAITGDLVLAEQRATELNDRLDTLQLDFDFRGLELADAEQRATQTDNELRRLRRELAAAGNSAAYSIETESVWDRPDDVLELVLRLDPSASDHPVVQRVIFTGDVDLVQEVQSRDQSGLFAQRCWDFVRVLHDYADAKAKGTFSGNVHSCLQSDTYDGFKVPLARHSYGETEQTMNQWGDERVFPVPTNVDPRGYVVMEAHFKIDQSNTFAPRLHYYDDTTNTGKIYIGYIGRHLTNTKTRRT